MHHQSPNHKFTVLCVLSRILATPHFEFRTCLGFAWCAKCDRCVAVDWRSHRMLSGSLGSDLKLWRLDSSSAVRTCNRFVCLGCNRNRKASRDIRIFMHFFHSFSSSGTWLCNLGSLAHAIHDTSKLKTCFFGRYRWHQLRECQLEDAQRNLRMWQSSGSATSPNVDATIRTVEYLPTSAIKCCSCILTFLHTPLSATKHGQDSRM